ncbi:MAG: hypothetical protein NTV72_01340 [Candidatus Taylorbacteria bacterium]|nr:hypothetical protein [Candidatus Taylorbacteria bacterium]
MSKLGRLGKNPDFDWNVIIVMFAFLSICVVFYSVSLFLDIGSTDDQSLVLIPVDRENLDINSLQKVVDRYEHKKVVFDGLLKNSVKYEDPSI